MGRTLPLLESGHSVISLCGSGLWNHTPQGRTLKCECVLPIQAISQVNSLSSTRNLPTPQFQSSFATSMRPSQKFNLHPSTHSVKDLETKTFDVLCIGSGWAGRQLAAQVCKAGFTALVIEKELLGGESTLPSDVNLILIHSIYVTVPSRPAFLPKSSYVRRMLWTPLMPLEGRRKELLMRRSMPMVYLLVGI